MPRRKILRPDPSRRRSKSVDGRAESTEPRASEKGTQPWVSHPRCQRPEGSQDSHRVSIRHSRGLSARLLVWSQQPRPPTRPDLRCSRVSDLGFVVSTLQAGVRCGLRKWLLPQNLWVGNDFKTGKGRSRPPSREAAEGQAALSGGLAHREALAGGHVREPVVRRFIP